MQDPITKRFDLMKTQQLSYGIVAFLIVILLLFGSSLSTYFYAVFILVLKTFVCLGFGTIYVVHLDLFDSSFLGTSYGICNVASRLAVIAAPMVAEVPDRTVPLIVLLVMNALALGITYLLKKKEVPG